MAESASLQNRSETSPLTGPTAIDSAIDPQGLSTVHEVSHHGIDYQDNESLDNRLRSTTQDAGRSGDASLKSSAEQSYDEKQLEPYPHRLRHTSPTQGVQQARQHSQKPSGPLQNGNGTYTNMGPGRLSTKPASPKKEKRGGLKNTIRRIFGRRSTRDRISVPNAAVYPRHDPGEFITSATDVKAKRAASMPPQNLLRTSGLSSHPPFQAAPSPPPAMKSSNIPNPPPPDRRPPERPVRPRSASVPSFILNKEEIEAADVAMTGIGLQNPQEQQTLNAENIGFAVTNGSNPRRRSRSVGALRDTEHRMSPIQWRRWRRRSDELRYWRASSDLTSLGIKGLDSPVTAQKDDDDFVNEDEGVGHNGDFNFGLQSENLQNQERIGLEERIVTLEIKLMDFEYAISKMQAESTSSSKKYPQSGDIGERRDSVGTYDSSDRPAESSPSMAQGTPSMISSQWVKDIYPQQRPTSVATTLKPGHAGQPGLPRKNSVDRSTHSSLTGLTVDHYTTLITLLRNEQSARQRLEKQVSILQGRLDSLSPPNSSHSHAHSTSHHSNSRSLSSSQRRHAFVDLRGGKQMSHLRPRSSSYSTNETDTDDDAFHDVYVTPNITPVELERGEYERGAFNRVAVVEEGMAF